MRDLPYNRLAIKLKDPRNREHITRIKKAIRERMELQGFNSNLYSIRDVVEDLENLEKVQFILKVIFSFIISITMFLCFFSLSASMGANLYTQAKEIGVMRAIGVSKFYIIRIYVYEAFILVASSAFQGICIGLFIGYLITDQQATFIQLPLSFEPPNEEVIQILIISILCAFISTYGPTKRLMNRTIPDLWRNNF